jgi:uncharacterized membrane protein YeaQ/YmgE (transglycosylase-associated protein family)
MARRDKAPRRGSNVPDLWTTPRAAQFLVRIRDNLTACDMVRSMLRARLIGWSPLPAGRPARSRGFRQQPGEMTMTLEPMSLIVWLVVGLIAGWLAGQIVKGYGLGLVGNLVVGVVGALIGGWLLGLLNIQVGGGILAAIINATVGAVVLLLIIGLFKRT